MAANFKEPEGHHWLKKQQEYDFTIVYQPGQRHSIADALSRFPSQQCSICAFYACMLLYICSE